MKKKGLGRGLGALLKEPIDESTDRLRMLPIDALQAGKYQPRTLLDHHRLNELAQSIKQQGLIQPVLVRLLDNDRYEIVAGERRWRAAKMAGLTKIPALIREIPNEQVAVSALIENMQRENLNPLEEAAGLQRLIEEFGMTHDAIADAIGKSRSQVSNLLRLLTLSEPVRELLMQGYLDMGHARALLSLPETRQIQLAKLIALKHLSVRETEKLAQKQEDKLGAAALYINNEIVEQENRLSARLGAKVSIRHLKKGGGRVTIECADVENLINLLARL